MAERSIYDITHPGWRDEEIARLRDEVNEHRDLGLTYHRQAVELKEDNDRLQELLRGTGANRYWEGRWRDEHETTARHALTIMGLRAALEEIANKITGCAEHVQNIARKALANERNQRGGRCDRRADLE